MNWRRHLPLAGITGLALILRLWGVTWGVSCGESRPDEMMILTKALGYGGGDFNPHFFNYPSLLSYLLFACYGVYAAVLMATGAITSLPGIMVRLAEDPGPFILISRGVSVIMGTLAVPFLYMVCRRSFGRVQGLMAALFLAVAYLPVRDAHFGVTDTPMMACVVAAHIPIIGILLYGRRRDYIWAGILAGLAAGFKYNAALLAFPILLAHILAGKQSCKSCLSMFDNLRLFCPRLWLAAAMMAGVFLATSPFILLDWSSFVRDFMFEVRHLSGVGEVNLGRGWGYHLRVSLWYGVGPAMLLAALAGVILALMPRREPRGSVERKSKSDMDKQDRQDREIGFESSCESCPSMLDDRLPQWKITGVLLAFPVCYYVLIGKGFTVFVRYILPVVPFVCLFAGVAAGWIIMRFGRRWGRGAGVCSGVAVVVLVAGPMLVRVVDFNRLICRPDTREQAVEYAKQNLPTGTQIGWVGTRYGMPRFPETAEYCQRRYDEARQQGAGGRYLKAKVEAARRSRYGVELEVLSRERLRGPSGSLPGLILLEEYPLPYTQNVSEGVRALLEARGYRVEVEFKSAEWELLDSCRVVFDKQDSLYAPYAGCGEVERPGPNLSLWGNKRHSHEPETPHPNPLPQGARE